MSQMRDELTGRSPRAFQFACVLAIVLGGFGLRMYGIERPPVHHDTRQFIGLLRARAYYYFLGGTPAGKRQMALAQAVPPIEPPVLELVTAPGYVLLGRAAVGLPRILSALAWCLGAFALFALVRRVLGPEAALCAVAYYLLTPFGVIVSRAVQPDPLAVGLFCLAMWRIYVYAVNDSWANCLTAAAATGAAIFVKVPLAIFLGPTFFGAMAARRPWTQMIRDVRIASFGALSLLPAVLWLSAGRWLGASNVAKTSFLSPQALLAPGWPGKMVEMIRHVHGGWPVILLALFGVVATWKTCRTFAGLVAGGIVGYGILVCVCAYHMFTHDYYHQPAIPVLALGLAGVAGTFVGFARQLGEWQGFLRAGAKVLFVLAVLSAFMLNVRAIRSRFGKGHPIATYEAIGEATAHTRSAIWYAPRYGYPLQYYAWITGHNWPQRIDFISAEITGQHVVSGLPRLRNLLETQRPTHFIVHREQPFREAEPEVHALLRERCPVVFEDEGFVVFEIRGLDLHDLP